MNIFEISGDKAAIGVSVDLVTAARRHLYFLQTVSESHFLYNNSSLCHAIRRYDELWMPLVSDLTIGTTPPILLPPLDVQWVWHCHALNPTSYRRYCEEKFSKVIEKPLIYDGGNEEYALNRCFDVWSERYPSEPFDLEQLESISNEEEKDIVANQVILSEVRKHGGSCSKFSAPYMLEIVYLISAKQRYSGFMYLLKRFKDRGSRFVPTLDIQLMWLTHQSYPLAYAEDVKGIEEELGKVVGVWENVKEEDVEGTKKLWEEVFDDQPYERAGATLDDDGGGVVGCLKPPVYWAVADADVNTKYNSIRARFLSEVCVFVARKAEWKTSQDKKNDYISLRSVRCHREMKLDKTINSLPFDNWIKSWHLYTEFSTRGVILELRHHGSSCLKNNVRSRIVFLWNDLLRAPCLTFGKDLGKEVKAVASITPPVQAPYLLKCVPDRVSDDSGAMVSDEILKMNRYRPQEGRWLSRTVLDHTGKECFVLRIRVGSGIWRRGGETPQPVKWEDRIIEVREGPWTYIVGPIGKVSEKVVGTATPKERSHDKASWSLSTGEELTLHRVSSGLIFNLQNKSSTDSVRLLQGRKLQYQLSDEVNSKDEEDKFVTLVRYTPGNPNGRATALINWRFAVMEFLPEEDSVTVLLICMAILRSVSEMVGEDMGNLLVRRRLKEHKHGMRDWGSVVIHSKSLSPLPSPFLQPWHWNAKEVMTPIEADYVLRYSPAEGGDTLYKRGVGSRSKGLAE